MQSQILQDQTWGGGLKDLSLNEKKKSRRFVQDLTTTNTRTYQYDLVIREVAW